MKMDHDKVGCELDLSVSW